MTIEDIDDYIEFSRKKDIESIKNLLEKLGYSFPEEKFVYNQRQKDNIEEFLAREIEKKEEMVEYIKKKSSYSNKINSIILLLKKTNNVKYFLENRKKYRLSDRELVNMIIRTKDIVFMKEVIEKSEKYDLSAYDIRKITLATKDTNYIKSMIRKKNIYEFGKIDLIELIAGTKDPEYIKKCIDNKESDFIPKDIHEIIIESENIDLIKYYIENNDEYNFSSNDLREMLEATKDLKYVIDFIEKRKETNLLGEDIGLLIKNTQNEEFMKKCINNKEKYNLSKADILYILSEVKDKAFIEKTIEENFVISKPMKKINLPGDMTIGIEIESAGKYYKRILEIYNKIIEKWKCEIDGSLIGGVEVISPILQNKKEDIEEIYLMCEILKSYNQKTPKQSGAHIHIGADYLTSKESYKKLLELWCNTEKILYLISNEKKSIPRDLVLAYANPISKVVQESIENRELNIEKDEEKEEFILKIKQIQNKDRKYGINFLNIGQTDKNTIEIRIPNGTINPDVWIENINLFGGIIESAEEIAKIDRKDKEKRTGKENEILHEYEKIVSGKFSEKEKLLALLNLTVEDENKNIFIERYKENVKILKDNHYYELELDEKISKTSIIIRRNDLAKTIFKGKDRIDGNEYVVTEGFVKTQMEEKETKNKDNIKY